MSCNKTGLWVLLNAQYKYMWMIYAPVSKGICPWWILLRKPKTAIMFQIWFTFARTDVYLCSQWPRRHSRRKSHHSRLLLSPCRIQTFSFSLLFAIRSAKLAALCESVYKQVWCVPAVTVAKFLFMSREEERECEAWGRGGGGGGATPFRPSGDVPEWDLQQTHQCSKQAGSCLMHNNPPPSWSEK